ncbi:putative peroxisomal N(1)-acetyl-spermine/spermidine oxidase [Rhypophila decipiens]|uniref:Peroxisomal N(1)-acetyl-spermine/spermidine oxidase n=1 Tax=Rhypophila decipiens TaxID=261697 RepID=A0AAN6YIC2_9PEZI|nr:putative peroxisomal N(1)-acetyl-spermine/spermidine oxidase [Rhypophila decipiens]
MRLINRKPYICHVLTILAYNSSSRGAHKKTSRIYQDLKSARGQAPIGSLDNKIGQLRSLSIMDRVREEDSLDRTRKPHIGVVGAGLAGLRGADVLLSHGFRVTILEARNRVGGRMYQETLSNGHIIDMGPNWIHGTKENPMLELAAETDTAVSNGEENTSCVFDEDGQLLPLKDGEMFSTIMWDIVGEAFKYSNQSGSEIDVHRSLRDYFEEQAQVKFPDTEDDYERKRQLLLQTAELWGSFIGSPVEKQSLKFLWLEECIDGENPFCAGTYSKILEKIAHPALNGASIQFNTRVTEIQGKSTTANNTVVVKTADGRRLEFDELLLTTPLGWLKQNTHVFRPPLPDRLTRAINSIGYGCLEKVYISFPKSFWLTPDEKGQIMQGFYQWLSPKYASDTNPNRWTQELVELGSLDGPSAHPTLLFYIYGEQSKHLTSQVRARSTKKEKDEFLISYFKPYYSRLPSYKEDDPDCQPVDCVSTDWLGDDLAGNGSYCNFPVGLEEGDEDLLTMRAGVPSEGIWLAGEHTAPFVAVGTATGAYWSGEDVGRRIVKSYGKYNKVDEGPETA